MFLHNIFSQTILCAQKNLLSTNLLPHSEAYLLLMHSPLTVSQHHSSLHPQSPHLTDHLTWYGAPSPYSLTDLRQIWEVNAHLVFWTLKVVFQLKSITSGKRGHLFSSVTQFVTSKLLKYSTSPRRKYKLLESRT